MRSLQSPLILLVEDSTEDYEMILRSLQKCRLDFTRAWCKDGDEALKHLHAVSSGEGARRPTLILLDLNLPGTDGREVLHEIKASAELNDIPVVVLTTSGDERDIAESYRAGANSYIVKPVTGPRFVEAMRSLKGYWFELVALPA